MQCYKKRNGNCHTAKPDLPFIDKSQKLKHNINSVKVLFNMIRLYLTHSWFANYIELNNKALQQLINLKYNNKNNNRQTTSTTITSAEVITIISVTTIITTSKIVTASSIISASTIFTAITTSLIIFTAISTTINLQQQILHHQ
ncbi:hypothetical protein Glove_71g170 [Diversispora epigaea]|uniref:Uncharacterized protein n=1 Tax=Diversispora epigaea TaxID=1348612 RepID=A0A397JAS5_9GLOM|nr:hypothetical protein Glove_71g170 [Diversispora epigaea]